MSTNNSRQILTSLRSNRRCLARLFSYARRYRRQLALGVTLGLASGAAELGQVVTLKHAVESAAGQAQGEVVLSWVGLFAVCGFVAIAAEAGHNWRMSVTSQRLVLDLQNDVHRKLHAISEDLMTRLSPGEFAHLTLQDTAIAQQGVGLVIGSLVRHPATLLALICYLVYLDGRTAALALLGYGLVVGLVRVATRGLQEQARQLQEARAAIHQRFLNLLNGRDVLRCFDSAGKLVESLPRANAEFHRQASRYIARKFTATPLARAIATGFVVTLVCYAGWRLRRGEISAGTAAAIAGSLVAFYQPVSRLSGLSTDLLESLASARRVFDVLDAPSRSSPSGTGTVSSVPVHSIEFAGVHREFADREFGLRSVSFRLEAGQIVLVIGASGSGKTTLVRVLTTVLTPTAGSVLFNDVPAAEVSQRWLLRQLAYLPQGCPAVGRTILEEIQLGRDGIRMFECEHAARCAEALEWIRDLPETWQTAIGANATLISGGQRERLALARVFVADRSLYVLDEPTAHLDRATEARVISRLCRHIRDRNGIGVIVSHHRSLIAHADRVLELKNGSCVELDVPSGISSWQT